MMKQRLTQLHFANYFTKLLCLGLFLTPSVLEAQIQGKAFRDFNANGVFDSTATFKEIGLSGITVTAFNAAGTSVGTTTTNATGHYTIPSVSGAVRVEFSGLATGDYSGPKGTGSNTSVQFVTAPTTSVNYGVNYPSDYCGTTNPQLATPCYINGNPAGGGSAATGDVFVGFPFNATANDVPTNLYATGDQIGSTWGVAYQRKAQTLYTSAFLKRHVGLGPLGIGGIYKVNGTSATPASVNFVDVKTIGIDVGTVSSNTTRGLPADMTLPSHDDPLVFDQIGKVGMGDLDITDDGKTLFLTNLNDRKLYSIIIDSDNNSATAPTAADVQSFTIPNPGCTNGVARPFGIKIYKGKVYVGVVCTAENAGGTVNNMFAYIYAMDLATGVFNATPVYSFPLNYPKLPVEAPDGPGWQSWTADHTQFAFSDEGSRDRVIRPQPMLADIAFDVDGSMILTFIDRTGHQYGFLNYSPDVGSTRLYNAEIGGDILRVANVNGTFQLEHNGTAGALTGADVGNGGGPGTLSGGSYTAPFGEFYNDLTDATIHNDCSQGGSVLLAGSDKIAACFMDPINWTSGGIVTWSNTNGAQVNHYELYSSNSNVQTFGKANGLGDLEILCNAAPLEIGNRVWTDTNNNGIQDGGETGIDGVIVELYDGATKVGTTTTANSGQYYFNNANVNLNGATELKPNTAYKIQIASTQFNNTGVAATPLSNLGLTTANATSTGLVDVADNDATVVSGLATISYTTGNYGENNHSLDFGFAMPSCAIALTTNVSGCYDSNGNTAGGSSVATVQAIVDWSNNPSGETINVTCTGATTQSINPATASKPAILNFQVPANGSAVTVTTTFSTTTTCTATQNVTAPAGTCLLTPCETGNTGGTVWRDFNNDGVKDGGETQGVVGVTVTAYDCNGAVAATTTTDYLGQYTFTTLTPSATNKYRIEFSNLPPQYKPSFNGTNGRTDVQFITAASCTVHYGVNNPTDYCQANPQIATTCFINGLANATTPNDALVRWAYDNTGATSKIGDKIQIGAAWGVAFQRQSNKLFLAAYAKRHVDWGPLGANGLYVTTNANTIGTTANTASFVNLNTINPAFDVGTVVRNFSGSTNPTQPNHDQNMFPLVGKIGLGDIEVSEDGSYLYVMNLNDRKLWRVEIGQTGTAPTAASQIVDYSALPNPCTNSTFRPFAVKAYKGEIYVGGVCDGVSVDGTTVDRNNLKLTVYKTTASATPNSAVWTSVLDYPLTFNRLAHANGGYGNGLDTADYYDSNGTNMTLSNTSWHPWARNFGEISLVKAAAQPVLMNIEFDVDGSMVLGISDRSGDIAGHLNYGTNTGSTTLYIVDAPGDIMRAANVNGTFFMEANGTAGGTTTAGAGNGDGPGGGEFYFHDRYGYVNATSLPFGNLVPSPTLPGYNHEETTLGGLALIPGTGKVLVTAFDPQYTASGNGFYSGGIRYYSNSDGTATNARTLYSTTNAATFGKANGLGDLEALCDPAPIQIGNYVWLDQNKNGVQDPCESPLSNVTITLWKNEVQIASTTTNSNGEYYFSSKSNLAVPANWTGTGADTTLRPSMDYKIKILKTQAKLDTTQLTTANAVTGSGNDQNDSDAAMVGDTAVISLTTGLAGSTNHTFEFGFAGVCNAPTITNVSADAATCTAGVANSNAAVHVTGIAGMAKYAYRTNATDSLWANTATASTASSIDLTGLANPVSAATYIFRLWGADTTCYNDTTVVLAPSVCSGVSSCCTNIFANGNFEMGTFNPATTFGGYSAMDVTTLTLPEWAGFDSPGYWFDVAGNKKVWMQEPSSGSGFNFCMRNDIPASATDCWEVGHTYHVCVKVAAYDPTNAAGGIVDFVSEIESPLRDLKVQSLTTNGSTNNNLSNLNWVTVCYDFTLQSGESKFYLSVKKGTNPSPTIGIVFDDLVVIDKTVCSTPPTIPLPADNCTAVLQYLTTPCYVNGDPLAVGSTSANDHVLVNFPLTASGSLGSGGTPLHRFANANQVGSTWGVASQSNSGKIFSAAMLKRHVGLGPNGLGAIYESLMFSGDSLTVAMTTTKFVDLVADLGLDVGQTQIAGMDLSNGATSNIARSLPADKSVNNTDGAVFAKIAKIGLGDMDIDEAEQNLFVVNLHLKKIHKINIAAKTLVASYDIPATDGASGTTMRPFGLEIAAGKLYAGVVYSKENPATLAAQDIATMTTAVYQLDLTSGIWATTPVISFPLNYAKGDVLGSLPAIDKWNVWQDNFAEWQKHNDLSIHPQPILSDMVMDNSGALHLAFMDRAGNQTGFQNNSPDAGIYPGTTDGYTGGDLLRTANVSGVLVLENNGAAGAFTGSGVGNAQGPGNGEFYSNDDKSTSHYETSWGGLAMVRSSGQLVLSIMDPFDYTAGGLKVFSTTNGSQVRAYQLYRSSGSGSPTFGKANGIGGMDLICVSPCSPPSVTSVKADTATCTNGVANSDAKVAVRGIIGMTKYAYRTNATDSLWAINATASTLDSIQLTGLTNPTTARTYTFRMWASDTTCYNDTTVVLNPKDCFVQQPITCGMFLDEMSAEQNHSPYNSLTNLTSVLSDNSILLGGERDVYFYDFSSSAAPVGNGVYIGFNAIDIVNGTGEKSRLSVQWDGKDGDAINLNPSGLGGLNFSTIDRITADIAADFPSMTSDSLPITFELWSNSGAASSLTKNFKFLSGVSSPIEFKLSEFIASVGAGVNLANIGAVVLKIDMANNAVSTRNGWDVNLANMRLVCPSCTPPSVTSVKADTATCTNGVANSDAKVAVRGIVGMTKYAYRTNATDSLWAINATALTRDSIQLTGLSNPAMARTYTFRIWGVDTTCYNDTTVVLPPSVCLPCPTLSLPTDTALCSAALMGIRATLTNITTQGIKFVYFTSHETDPAVIYGGTGTDLGTVANISLTDSKTVATLSGVSFPVNITLSPITYHVYALLDPDPGVGNCRAFAHRQYTVNPIITGGTATVDTVTCTNGVFNTNGRITISGIGNGAKYSYGTSGTTGLFALNATTLVGSSIVVSNLANPASATVYTFRIYGTDTTCYQDVTATLPPSVCPTCSITATFTQGSCNNNGTTAIANDDYFTITVSAVSATNGGASGKYEVVLNGIVLNTGGTTYGTSVTVGTATTFKSDGATTYQLKVRDLDRPSCETTIFTTTTSAACSTLGCKPTLCVPVTVTRVN